MEIIRTIEGLKEVLETAEKQNLTIGLVPTMGALHEGHISLVERAVKDNDKTVVSIFVNPTQFNNPDDLKKYPRTEAEDFKKLEEAGVDFVFAPDEKEVYPEPDMRVFDLGPVAEVMEGKMRPGHFNGVAQIVSKLFEWVKPTRAYFGEKDFQQIAVIKQMVRLLNLEIEIVECPINREPDGLARSSRNVRLTAEQRKIAPEIYHILKESVEWKKLGMSVDEVEKKVLHELGKTTMVPEYYAIVNSATLQPILTWEEGNTPAGAYPIGCIAVFCGDVRLIDNIKYLD